MKFFSIHTLMISLTILSACHSKDKTQKAEPINPKLLIYRSSVTLVNDLIETRLDLKPDFKNQEMQGLATLTLKPHFYPVDSLILDAKYMRILRVGLLKNKGATAVQVEEPLALSYAYDSLKLRIALDKRYTQNDTYQIQIAYVAQPEKISKKGSTAISGSKGLYFINPDGKAHDLPTQLWTQGETEAASCWFPTIDAPNQKSSQILSVELPSKFKSISNGLLTQSVQLNDSMRRDVWVQKKPHAPYLFALVIGDFAEIKDQWKQMPVNYYVEPAYEKYAALVFGNTPKMLSFFSERLGVPYPWDKYHQVVVRNFVSGAMENTGCVVFYDKLQHDHREHLDATYEDVIAHELFHHWFGDLVTCESWSNLPLNESFATYGEYLWNEHQYGRDEADYKLSEFNSDYLNESTYKSENLIRYHYLEQEDLFDAHSYQKGGSILHMLRKYLGDDAFFTGLKTYLVRHSYQTAEISDLRQAFEEVSGEDLNWFFNQWFLDKGHPHLQVTHGYSPEKGYTLRVIQKEKRYRLYIDVDVTTGSKTKRQRIRLDKDTQEIKIAGAEASSFVQFDAENQLLSETEEIKTKEQWKVQLEQAPLAAHRLRAFNYLIKSEENPTLQIKYCQAMISDAFWFNRKKGLNWANAYSLGERVFNGSGINQALNEPVAAVREAYVYLFRAEKDEKSMEVMLGDSSYNVLNRALISLGIVNPKKAFAFADKHREASHRKMQDLVFTSIARFSAEDETDFFIRKIKESKGVTVDRAAGALSLFILYNQTDKAEQAFTRIELLLKNKDKEEEYKNAFTAAESMRDFFYYQIFYMQMVVGVKKELKSKYKPLIELSKKNYQRMDDLIKSVESKK